MVFQSEQMRCDDNFGEMHSSLQWLYSGNIITTTIEGRTGRVLSCVALARLYVLGEKLVDCCFQNHVMDSLMSVLIPTGLQTP